MGQEEVAQLPVNKGGILNSRGLNFSTQIYNSKYLINLFVDNGTMNVRLLDSDFNQISKTLERGSDYGLSNELVGHKKSDSIYSFVFSNDKRTRLVITTFDFTNDTSERNKIDLNFKGERLVEAFTSHQNRFFVFSASIQGELILRELNHSNTALIEVARFTIDDKKFNNDKIKFKYHFLYSKAFYTTLRDDTPASLEKALQTYKVYGQGNKLILTCESSGIGTSVYAISLDDKTLDYKLIEYSQNENNDLKKFNSFVSNDVIFQIGISSQNFLMTIKNMEGSILKEHGFSSGDSITFKNTPILQEKEYFFSIKNDFENSRCFLRKMSSEIIGISVQNKNDSYEILIGGRKENVLMGLISVTNAIVLPTSQTIAFTSILDKNFNHIPGPIPNSTFEMLKKFEKNLKRDSHENIFLFNGVLFYSYLDNKDKMLKFIKF